jgi:hypothetical protein
VVARSLQAAEVSIRRRSWRDDTLFDGPMAVQGGMSSAGFWDIDEACPPLRRRAMRTVAVASAWAVSALPLVAGRQRCAIALFCHRPCPGCGMTRAIRLLVDGDVAASLRMHPLALPAVVASVLVAFATVWATMTFGSPMRTHRTRLGRVAIAFGVAVYGATFAVWVLRWFGFFGGPVPV